MRTRTRIAFATAVCLTAAGRAPADGQAVAARSCAADEIVGWVGLQELDCNCTITGARGGRTASQDEEPRWSFRSEPVVGTVAPGSPAAGVLRDGDVIVAVDGHLITTAEGGRRFGRPVPDRPLVLRIRRDGREMNVRLTPLALCRTDRRLGAQTPRSPTATATPRRAPQPSRAPGRASPAPPTPPPPTPQALLPTGRLGFGVSCSACGWTRPETGGEPRFFFEGPLQVYSIEPGSPADRAGLRRGDVITHVDGLAITSDGGGRRIADIEPHESVRYTIRRGTSTVYVTLRATDRAAAEAMGQRALRERLERIGRMRDLEAAQREIVALARLLEPSGTENVVRARSSVAGDANQLRYSGQVGEAEVEVRGSGAVIATILEPNRDLRIVTDQATIRIRIPREGR